MTAVEWLFENLCSEKLSWIKDSNGKLFFDETTSNIFQQAKEMEKQQVLDFAYYFRHEEFNKKQLEQYYNEKFKNKSYDNK